MRKLRYLSFGLLLITLLPECKKPDAEVTGIIEGIIISAQTSQPVKGAIVSVGSSSSKTTGDDGKYRFDGLEAKEYTIQVQAEGYETNTKTIVAVAGETKVADFSLVPLVPVLNISTLNLDFGKDGTVLPVTITNKGKGVLSWSVTENVTWLSVNPASGTTTSETSSVNVNIDRNGLTQKAYTTNIIINSNGGDATIMVLMIVQGPVPTALFTVTPSAGAVTQSFQVDASSSIDDIDPTSALFVRWRWEDGGAFTDWVTIKTAIHQYTSEGLKNITLEVRDSDGHIGTVTKTVLVSNSLQFPFVLTTAMSNISNDNATTGGEVINDGGTEVTARGVCWGKNQNPTIFDSKTTNGSGLGEYSSEITGLTSGSSYYVRAYATNSVGTGYGNEIMFIAGQNSSTPTVTTNEASNITAVSANCGGIVSSEGSSPVTVRGVCWSSSQNPTIDNDKTTDGSGNGSFISIISALSANTRYYVRAYATNNIGTSYGNEITFTTAQAVTVPGVLTTNATNITENSALSGGDVVASGGASVIARGVCWSTNQNPTLNDPHSSDGSGTGVFTSIISDLSPSTIYYIRAYATNSAGTGFGSQISFTTSGTFPSVVTNNVTNILETSAIAGGIVLSEGGSGVTERGVCYSTTPDPTIYSNKKTSGSGPGQFTAPLNTLIPNTIYYIKAYAINSIGISYGDEKTFTTLSAYYQGFEYGLPSGWSGMWTISTDNPYEGYYSLKSTIINDSIKFTKTVNNSSGGQISFMVYCQINGGNSGANNIAFYIDGVLQATILDYGSWNNHTYSISSGLHIFKWIHGIGSTTANTPVYIDYVICPD
jgi:hypothetical protein